MMTETNDAQPKPHKRFKCKVYRLNVERENSELPISVNVVGKKKRFFSPGEEVILHDYHIGVLKNAVDATQLEINEESAIYAAPNPKAEAEKNFPGFKAVVSSVDGRITLIKEIPLYSVEVISKE